MMILFLVGSIYLPPTVFGIQAGEVLALLLYDKQRAEKQACKFVIFNVINQNCGLLEKWYKLIRQVL